MEKKITMKLNIKSVKCDKGHSGNRSFVRVSRGSTDYQCQGCGTFVSRRCLIDEAEKLQREQREEESEVR